ncbi:hypothetical protein TNCV_3064581 [Trichonephila clavipes]|nr:hypothetical protein TNCV_3064581 [Trichonephila clavipes]
MPYSGPNPLGYKSRVISTVTSSIVVNPHLSIHDKFYSFTSCSKTRDERKKKGTREKKSKESRERGAGLGWRKGKSPALDGEGMRGEPWLERTGSER